VSVATKLADDGHTSNARVIGEKALKDGKFEQAIRIFDKLDDPAKIAEANYLSARDCQRKGGSPKIVISRMFAAIQASGRLLKEGGSDDRLRILRRMTIISGELSKVLDGSGDYIGAADCHLFRASLFKNLVPYGRSTKHFSLDPAFFESVPGNVRKSAMLARDRYKRHIESNNISPESPEGKAIVAKLRKVNDLI